MSVLSSSKSKIPVAFTPDSDEEVNTNSLYSTTYEWLVTFKDFCRQSEGSMCSERGTLDQG